MTSILLETVLRDQVRRPWLTLLMILSVALGVADVLVQSDKALRDSALVIFDRTSAITLTLRTIAVVVAFIGVLGARVALQFERTRELATLRAAGMTLAQLWRLTLLESGLMGAAAGVLAIPTGLLLAAILIDVINLRSFGWTVIFASKFKVPPLGIEQLFCYNVGAYE